MNAKSTSIRVVLLLMTAIMAVSCGQKTKGPASLSVASENKEAYIDGFKHYFKLVDNVPNADQRYVITVNGNTPAPQSGSFVINISDNGGKSVQINIAYTVGAKSENVTVVNPNFVSGSMNVNKDLNVELNDNGQKSRAQSIATAIYRALVDIEGK